MKEILDRLLPQAASVRWRLTTSCGNSLMNLRRRIAVVAIRLQIVTTGADAMTDN